MHANTYHFIYAEATFGELNSDEQQLVRAALQSAVEAYAPYSHFCVGAAILLEDGTVVTANNQENEAYPSGLCAERNALFYTRAHHHEVPIKWMAIAARNEQGPVEEPVFPCGACRQVMLEYAKKQSHPIRLYMAGTKKVIIVNDVRQLLPFAFSL